MTALRTLPRALVVGAVVLLLAACAAGGPPSPSGSAPSNASPAASKSASAATSAPGGRLTQAQLKVRLIDRFGDLWFCDPDFYPVARDDEGALAIRNWVQVTADADGLAAVAARLGIATATPTEPQKLAIYHEWKMLRAIALDPAGTDAWRFDYQAAPPPPSSANGTRTTGTIDARGTITVTKAEPGLPPNCPICLARGSLVETPLGAVAVEALRIGDPAWSRDGAGNRVAAMVIALGSVAAPAGHRVVRLTLADGRTLAASPGHPLPDGRRLGEVRVGDTVQGSVVVAADLVPYQGGETFDLLPSGLTGQYAVDGIWLGSTLRR